MELRVLNYFLMVAREGNITRAANLLHLTQPTLSRQLIQLEQELGVTLFRRDKHRISLTEEGLLLRRRAEEILLLSERTKEELRSQEGKLSGTVFLGSGELRSSRFLGMLVSDFHRIHPRVRFSLYSGNADNIKERIEQGLLDIGLVPEPVNLDRYDYVLTPVRERWGALLSASSPLAQKEALSPQDLRDMPLILPQREIVQGDLAHWFGELWEKVDTVASGNLLYNQAALARALGGCVLTMDLDSAFPDLKFIPLSPAIEVGTVLVWKKVQAFSPAAKAFLRHARSYILSITDDGS